MLPFFSGQFGNAASLQHAYRVGGTAGGRIGPSARGRSGRRASARRDLHERATEPTISPCAVWSRPFAPLAALHVRRIQNRDSSRRMRRANGSDLTGRARRAGPTGLLTGRRTRLPTPDSRLPIPCSHPGDRAPSGTRALRRPRGARRPGDPRAGASRRARRSGAPWPTPSRRARPVVSVMAGNNEIGVIQPLADIARLAHAAGAWFHTDASQAAGLVGHRHGGDGHRPALVHRAQDLRPEGRRRVWWCGGRRKSRSRHASVAAVTNAACAPAPSTSPGIVGFGEAARLARRGARQTPRGSLRCATASGGACRRRCLACSTCAVPNSRGCRTTSTSGSTASPGATWCSGSPTSPCRPGAACASTSAEPSHVLMALGLRETEARSSLRFGLLRTTTEAEVDELADRVIDSLSALRAQRPRLDDD